MGQLLTHVVCRSFGDDTIGNGDPLRRRLAGECVNAIFWRNVQGLERNRHVITMPEGLQPVADTYGRLWVDLDALHRAEREPLKAIVPQDTVPKSPETDYPAPVRVGNPGGAHTKYRLWDGQVIMGKTAALEAHRAGVDAERRRLESPTEPAAGSDTEMNSAGPEDEWENDSKH